MLHFQKEDLSVRRTNTIFPVNPIVFSTKTYTLIPRDPCLFFARTPYYFLRKPCYFFIEHKLIFKEPLFSHRTDINILGDTCRRAFSRNIPPSNRLSAICLANCFCSCKASYYTRHANTPVLGGSLPL